MFLNNLKQNKVNNVKNNFISSILNHNIVKNNSNVVYNNQNNIFDNFTKNIHKNINKNQPRQEEYINNNNNIYNVYEIMNNFDNICEIKTIDLFATPFVINIANSLAKIINDCGIECVVHKSKLTNEIIDKCINNPNHYLFIFCPHKFLQNKLNPNYPSNLKHLPKDKYFLYQLEKLDSNIPEFWNFHIKNLILNSKHSFDYSENNMKYYENDSNQELKFKVSHMIPPVVEFKDEYFVEWENKTIDVLFCGALTKRRQEIIDKLTKSGINVTLCTDVFGEELTKKIAQSKLFLNISTEYGTGFEYCRIHEALMSKNTHIISEKPDNFDKFIEKNYNIEYKNRITFIDKIESNTCEKIIDIINNINKIHIGYNLTNLITKNVKDSLNIYVFYPYLFHKYILGLRKIDHYENYNIIDIKKANITRKNLCHIHCLDLKNLYNMFGKYISPILKYFDIIVTYCIIDDDIINNIEYNNFTYIRINNYGMDIGPKFSVYHYLKSNNIDYNYIFYIHSKKDDSSRETYIKPFISNIDYIGNILNNYNEQNRCFFNNLQHKGDSIYTKKWLFNKLYVENILKYLDIKENKNNVLFNEGNFYILHKNIIDKLFSDKLLYNILNTNDSFDYNWVKNYYKLTNINLYEIYNYYKKNKIFGNNLETNKGHKGLADAMIEHTFERLPITLCKEYNIRIDILS